MVFFYSVILFYRLTSGPTLHAEAPWHSPVAVLRDPRGNRRFYTGGAGHRDIALIWRKGSNHSLDFRSLGVVIRENH
jgi:hypothetical protein